MEEAARNDLIVFGKFKERSQSGVLQSPISNGFETI